MFPWIGGEECKMSYGMIPINISLWLCFLLLNNEGLEDSFLVQLPLAAPLITL